MKTNRPYRCTVSGRGGSVGCPGLLLLCAIAATPTALAQPWDLVIVGARVVDGTGNPWTRTEIAVHGDTIVAVGPGLAPRGRRVLDAHDRVLAPGFIDIHTHAADGLFEVPTAENYVRQGVTTLFDGQDGDSAVPLAPFLAHVEETPIAVNFASFLGQGSVRAQVVGMADRPATSEEIERMVELVGQGMRDGAFGLSSGLFYVPGAFAGTDEVVTLARAAGVMGGIYISHIRDEASRVLPSVRETIRIGELAGMPTQITHHKIIGPAYWGQSVETLRLIDEARATGIDATLDQYPYTASSTSIQAALWPKWAQQGGREAVLARLADPVTRQRIRAQSAAIIRDERGGGDASRVQLASCDWDASLAGRTLAEVTRARGLEATLENAAETAMWIVEQGGCQGIFHAIGEEDLQRILEHPATMIASDGLIPVFGVASPHPRAYGTFPRVLGRYVRELHVITLEDAVRKMTSLPAQRTGLLDRGLVRPGMKADLVIFDPATVRDTASFDRPHSYPEGVDHVLVNGELVFSAGAMTAARPGRVLRGPAWVPAPPPSTDPHPSPRP